MALRLRPVRRGDLDTLEGWWADPEAQGRHNWFGFSRDDIGKFLGLYEERKLVPANPFVTIDRPGVGRLMQIASEEGRATRSDLKLGICGEHGGDPDSVRFCHELGLDYVSCSPFRVPTARLAAGQAALGEATAASK